MGFDLTPYSKWLLLLPICNKLISGVKTAMESTLPMLLFPLELLLLSLQDDKEVFLVLERLFWTLLLLLFAA